MYQYGSPEQAITSQLNAVSTSLQTVPSLTTYISALTPAVTAYNALGPNIFSDVQSQIATINNTITLVIPPLTILLVWLYKTPL